jgi:ankyrin repeat protein
MKNVMRFLTGLAAGLATITLLSACEHVPTSMTTPAPGAHIDVEQYDKEWFQAAREGRGFPIDAATPQGYTALILAAYDNQADTLRQLLAAGANACVADRNGNTALMGAIYKGEIDIARTLMGTQCNIDQTNNAGETALAFAALFGRFQLLPELVKKGADPNHIDARGSTAMQTVIAQGNRAAVEELKRVGATQ